MFSDKITKLGTASIREMRDMLFLPERIQYNGFAPAYLFFFTFINIIRIGYIRELPETKSQNWHIKVMHINGLNKNIANRKGFTIYGIDIYFGYPRIFLFCEYVNEFPFQCFLR